MGVANKRLLLVYWLTTIVSSISAFNVRPQLLSVPSVTVSTTSSLSLSSTKTPAENIKEEKEGEEPKSNRGTKNINIRDSITTLTGVDEFLDFLSDENSDDDNSNGDAQVAVIRFHADWCKSCRRLNPRYERIVKQYHNSDSSSPSSSVSSSSSSSFKFADVDYGKNTALCKTMNVDKLPSVHIYSKDSITGKIKMSNKVVGLKQPQEFEHQVNQALQSYLNMQEKEGKVQKE